MQTRRCRAALVVASLTVLAGCTGGTPTPSSSAASSSAPAPSATTSASPEASATGTPAAQVPSADDVRAGTRVRSHGATIWVAPQADVSMTSKKLADGSVRLTFHDRRDLVGDAPLAYATGSDLSAFADGSALAGGGGLAPTNASFAASGDDVLALTARAADGTAKVWFTGSAVEKTSWGNREGGRSLAVTPTDWARVGSLAASELTWSQLIADEPDADSPTMHEQLSCHELGAPDKATWNLEPWRPEVGALAMISARCNPT